MHISRIQVKNFRALEDIDAPIDGKVNVIVGPNAIGKTTVLESIRLVKALLSARSPNEPSQVLFALAASSPHVPQRINGRALLRNAAHPARLRVTYQLMKDELDWLTSSVPLLANNMVQAQHGQAFSNPAALLGYLSTPAGQQELQAAQTQLSELMQELNRNALSGSVCLVIDPAAGLQATEGALLASLIGQLDQRLPPHRSCFSYFPADRALPIGEQPIQIGAADAQQQLESHNSQPQLKYTRLKSTIFNGILMGDDTLKADFSKIFSGILRGRRLAGWGLNEVGLVSIAVEDVESGRTFDLDAMSSGEKGLILTSLLIERTVETGGVVMLDEPELHLNPAVCRDLLSFFIESYVKPKNLQLIICSHSPEILSAALDRDDCSLYHLESERLLTKVRLQDHELISEALTKLGTSEGDALLYRGTVFVEGPDDMALLDAGFSDLLRRYKIKDLGGRPEIEKQIRQLKLADGSQKQTMRAFIFDRDEAPTDLESTQHVRILQWPRRCFENYLIDVEILADVLQDGAYVTQKLKSVGEVQQTLKRLATAQLDEIAVKAVFHQRAYESPGLRKEDVRGGTVETAADKLYERVRRASEQLGSVDEAQWKRTFIDECEAHKQKLLIQWDSKWMTDCDGKRLFNDLHNTVQPRPGGIRKFKERIMQEMRLKQSAQWREIRRLLEGMLNRT